MLWKQPLWAIPFGLFFGILFSGDPADFVRAYQISLVFAFSIGILLWAVEHLLMPRLSRGDANPEGSWKQGFYYLGAALLGSYTAAIIVHFTLVPGFMGSARQVAISSMFALLFTALFGGINFAIVFYRESIARARAVEQIRAELAQAELRALRAQIHPHFLFNTLNSIASLIAVNPAAAEEITTRLAEVFRYTLRASEREHSPLGEELEFLRSYLEIERARFSDRLRVEEDVALGLESAPVPSLLLQPLVENAVRYGVSPRPEGGRVRIAARRDGDRLVLEVEDDGPGIDPQAPPSGTGFGLAATRDRLRAAGLPDALEIDSGPGRGTRIRITLPASTSSPSLTPGGIQ